MDILLNAVDVITGRVKAPNARLRNVGDDEMYTANVKPSTATATLTATLTDAEESSHGSDRKMMVDSSYHTQTISVASSEPSDDEDDDDDETATTVSDPPPRTLTIKDTGGDRIHWRIDPKQSFSDCILEVAVKSSHDTMTHVFTRPTGRFNPLKCKVATYYAHRSVLAYGHRRSLHFVSCFHRHETQTDETDPQDRKCRIYLPKIVAKAFPTMLDYLYEPEAVAANFITAENIVPLHFLSKILKITCLRTDTERFIEKNMTLANVFQYFTQAHTLNSQKICKAAMSLVIENLSKIKLQSNLLTDFNALTLWKLVLKSKSRKQTTSESIQISTLVACFCKLHRKELQKEDFLQLTDIRYMPVVHYQVALPLLEILKELRTTESTGTLNRLQMRCLDAFASSWKVWMKNPNFQQSLSKLDVFELYYLLNIALDNSEDQSPLIESIRENQAARNHKVEELDPTNVPHKVSNLKTRMPPALSSQHRSAPAAKSTRKPAPCSTAAPKVQPRSVPPMPPRAPVTSPVTAAAAPSPSAFSKVPCSTSPVTAAPRPAPARGPTLAPSMQHHTVASPPNTQVGQRAVLLPPPHANLHHVPSQPRAPPPPMPPQAQPVHHFVPQQAQQQQSVTFVAVPQTSLQRPPQQMTVIGVNAHPSNIILNGMNGSTMLVHPMHYQQLVQQREMRLQELRNLKRKEMGDGSLNPQQQQMAAAHHAAAMHHHQQQQQQQQQQHYQQQQQFAKRFRPNNIPYHPFPPHQPHYPPPPPAAPWYGPR